MTLTSLLILILILMLIGSIPTWQHAANWGFAPSGAIGLILVVLLILVLLGRI